MVSVLLIGNESLTAACGAQVVARGHAISCVMTRNADVRAWATGAGLRVEAAGDWAALAGLSVDWLLSVANLAVIPAAVLAQARGAVNFHDGPLPRHAGLNAPVWALLAGEAAHGIAWHMIGSGIDDGDVLEARVFDIGANDTALTLNTRCFEAALESFPAVLDQLERGLRPQPQDFSLRTVHLRDKRPAAMGRIDFAGGAKDVARLVRALDHGRYWNPLCTAKIALAGRVVNVGAAEVVEGVGAPGAVLAASAEGLVVACADGAVRLSRLTCQQRGLPVDPFSVTGGVLPALAEDEAAGLTAQLALLAPFEPRLRRALRGLQPATVSQISAGVADWQTVPTTEISPLALLRVLGLAEADIAFSAGPGDGYSSDWVPLRLTGGTIADAQAALQMALEQARAVPRFARDLMTRDANLADLAVPQVGLSDAGPISGTVVTLTEGALHYDAARLPDGAAFAARLAHVSGLIATRGGLLADVPVLTEAERQQVLHGWNQTAVDHDRTICVHTAFEAQVVRTPDSVALVCDGASLTYADLNARANRVAHVLMAMGVGPGVLVGLCMPRSLDMVVGALAIQKAGGAYVPMDPGYPADRVALYIEDSGCPVIVSHSGLTLPGSAQVLCLDTDARIGTAPDGNPASGVGPGDLAYMIYTSGSTGRPKGVMVEHRNVVNFFAGMDQRLGPGGGVWLAVTSLSFDISVLELFWTLARGFKVVLTSDENRALVAGGPMTSAQGMEFSLYYWGNDDGAGPKKYELLLEGAKFADTHGFCAVWTPERHFHAFGGPYPNPAVTGAAVAAVTKNIGVRGGSCVVPLHHPARVAEEWAVIDNLTGGRAGIAVASGWHPDDFVLRPENTPPANRAALFAATDQIRRLWRGETVDFPTKDGSFGVVTQPRPVSKELPIWVTTAGNPATWREAGEIGANVLTHLLGQTIAEVGEKITIYHDALRRAGHDPARFAVTVMLHTYVASDRESSRAMARGPMKDYLRSAAGLIKQYAWAFPAFKRPQGAAEPMDVDIGSLSAEELDAILDFAFQRYFEESGLFGTVEDALARVEDLKRIGVTEVACLIDYGIAPDVVLQSLHPLAEVVRQANAGGGVADSDFSIAAQIVRHGVTHLQCTPSMARMIATNDDSRRALAGVKTLMLGGEALPAALVADLKAATGARLFNMYGPTETTIWSSVDLVEGPATIGTPLANQRMYVLDQDGEPVAIRTEGELWIGGEGVARGYWQREELTAERFVPDPFVGGRMYRTGDLVRWRADGRIEFLGRTDHQVKLRGYRIELGEIETVLEAQPGVRQAVVLAREDSPGDLRLVAYVVGHATEAALREALTATLPEHMRPSRYVTLNAIPLTPNRKVDRKALPAPRAVTAPIAFVAPASTIEGQIAAIWARVLGLPRVGARDNFFALGGHSLLAVQVHREIRQALQGQGPGAAKLSITDIFRFPVLGQLAAHLDDTPTATAQNAAATNDRADARADAMARRRAMRTGRVDA
jgi:natural product biosynthesis luciferase-like monooxygenase protein